MSRTAEEIRSASSLAEVLPQDIVSHVTLIAASMLAKIEEGRQVS